MSIYAPAAFTTRRSNLAVIKLAGCSIIVGLIIKRQRHMSQAAGQVSDRENLIAQLRSLIGDRVSTSQSVREQHGRGESWHPVQAPDAVCFAQTNEEVAAIVRLAELIEFVEQRGDAAAQLQAIQAYRAEYGI